LSQSQAAHDGGGELRDGHVEHQRPARWDQLGKTSARFGATRVAIPNAVSNHLVATITVDRPPTREFSKLRLSFLRSAVLNGACAVMPAESLDRVPRAEREVACLTLCVSESNMLALKAELEGIRQHLLERYMADPEPERVVQVNIQMFPLSNKKG
jgi:hypothetical protein